MRTALTVHVGPGTLHHLNEISSQEGLSAEEIVEQAIQAWSYLRGDEERRRAAGAVIDIVVDRVRPHRRRAA